MDIPDRAADLICAVVHFRALDSQITIASWASDGPVIYDNKQTGKCYGQSQTDRRGRPFFVCKIIMRFREARFTTGNLEVVGYRGVGPAPERIAGPYTAQVAVPI
ncbi:MULTISPECIES: hypothetical protein [unclassified Bradyrhizobium]